CRLTWRATTTTTSTDARRNEPAFCRHILLLRVPQCRRQRPPRGVHFLRCFLWSTLHDKMDSDRAGRRTLGIMRPATILCFSPSIAKGPNGKNHCIEERLVCLCLFALRYPYIS